MVKGGKPNPLEVSLALVSKCNAMLKWIWNAAGAVERKKEGAVLQLHVRLHPPTLTPAWGFSTLMGTSCRGQGAQMQLDTAVSLGWSLGWGS